MTPPNVSAALRKVSALRTLCLRLPHHATPAERAHLRRFEALIQEPHRATGGDLEALVAGWRQWWREGNVRALHEMAQRVPPPLVAQERQLAALQLAAQVRCWEEIQDAVRACTACAGNARVAANVRQQTDAPRQATKLLIVSLAPPFSVVVGRALAASATNDPNDPLRLFVERELGRSWEDLTRRGLALLHAVKCAITPTSAGFQNPPAKVVDACAPRHLAHELLTLKPDVVLALGGRAYRAVVRSVEALGGAAGDRSLRLTRPPPAARLEGDGYPVRLPSAGFRLFASGFIRGRGRREAARALTRAAVLAGVAEAPPGDGPPPGTR